MTASGSCWMTASACASSPALSRASRACRWLTEYMLLNVHDAPSLRGDNLVRVSLLEVDHGAGLVDGDGDGWPVHRKLPAGHDRNVDVRVSVRVHRQDVVLLEVQHPHVEVAQLELLYFRRRHWSLSLGAAWGPVG